MWHCPWNDVELGTQVVLMDLFMLNVLIYSIAQLGPFKPDPFPQIPSKLKTASDNF